MTSHTPASRIKRALESGLWVEGLILLLAAGFRLLLLDVKPAHFDEGINGWFVDQMTRDGLFRYDPENYHGPLHFYVLFLFQTLFGRNLWAIRLPVVLVSLATVALALAFRRFTGPTAARVAGLGLALSPGMIFYGRYSIHESWLVLFLLLAVFGAVGLLREGGRAWIWPAVMGPVGAVLTKETYAIHAGCFLLAWPTLLLLERFSPSSEAGCGISPGGADRPRARAADWAWPVVAGLGAIFFFYSGNLYEPGRIAGLWETFAAWGATGTEGRGHEKPWDYWFDLLLRYEWAASLGLIGALCLALPGAPRLIRYLGIAGAGSLAAYTLIRYKTPWCLISVIWPFYFVLGHWVSALRDRLAKGLLPAALALLFAASAAWAIRLNFFRYTDDREPYVYVQTYEDIDFFTDAIAWAARTNPENYHMGGRIILPSYYPLPWLLGDFTRLGYYGDFKEVPDPADSGFILIEGERWRFLEKKMSQPYFVQNIRIRSAQEPARLYLNAGVFRDYFPGREPDFPKAR